MSLVAVTHVSLPYSSVGLATTLCPGGVTSYKTTATSCNSVVTSSVGVRILNTGKLVDRHHQLFYNSAPNSGVILNEQLNQSQ
jgi:hypothetical protein